MISLSILLGHQKTEQGSFDEHVFPPTAASFPSHYIPRGSVGDQFRRQRNPGRLCPYLWCRSIVAQRRCAEGENILMSYCAGACAMYWACASDLDRRVHDRCSSKRSPYPSSALALKHGTLVLPLKSNMAQQLPELPPSGEYIRAIRESSKSLREWANITVSHSSPRRRDSTRGLLPS